MGSITVEFSVKLPARVKKSGKWYIASCPIFDVCSQDETEKIALDNLKEALTAFFISCFERGTLDDVLKESGFEALKEIPRPSRARNIVDVPIPFRIPSSQ